jgi:hypothetical protein
MNFFNENKTLIIGLLLVCVGVFVYFTYFRGPAPSATLTETANESPISQDLLILLSNLHTIKLDNSIFSNPAFLSLTDFGVTIPPQNVGRRNPFAPIGK